MKGGAPVAGGGVELSALLEEMTALRAAVRSGAEARLAGWRAAPCAGIAGGINLAHYLALRRFDLRPLQERLAAAGLSSLGRGEAHILDNLDRIIAILQRALGLSGGDYPEQPPLLGHTLLAEHTDALFGEAPTGRAVRIMVTLPTEAADSPSFVRRLLEEGADCVRINCAHDDRQTWERMVERVRRASEETGRHCPILVDLAGHKLRTGAVAAGPAVCRFRAQRDGWGRIVGPATVRLYAGDGRPPVTNSLPLPESVLSQLAAGDVLRFSDNRGRARALVIEAPLADGAWRASCARSAWLASDTPLRWFREEGEGEGYQGQIQPAPFVGAPLAITLRMGDTLLLAREERPGRPAEGERPAFIPVVLPQVLDVLTPGAPVWIDDGRLGAEVVRVDREGAWLRITHAGPRGARLRADKGLNFPDTELSLPPLSDKDRADLDFVVRHADMVGFSFVESREDMEVLMRALADRGATQLPVVAKIETNRAVRNLPDIILGALGRHPLAIMIARGDLSVELGSVRLAEIQEEILWVCEAAHVPVVWATQVLETMTKKGVRSRPEFTDAAMGVRAECVMLNKGPHVVDAVRALGAVLERMEAHQYKKISRLRALHW